MSEVLVPRPKLRSLSPLCCATRCCHSTSMFTLTCRRFLRPVSGSPARFSTARCFANYTKIVQKKPKSSTEEPEPSSPPSCPLSPEQLDRIARNKRAALERLASAQTPPGFGESWRTGLAAEFGKTYFKEVRTSLDTARGSL